MKDSAIYAPENLEGLALAVSNFITQPTVCNNQRLATNKSSALNQIIKLACIKAVSEYKVKPPRLGVPKWVCENTGISKTTAQKAIFEQHEPETTLRHCAASMALVDSLAGYIPCFDFVRLGNNRSSASDPDINFRKIQCWLVSEIMGACRLTGVDWGSNTLSAVMGFNRLTQMKIVSELGYKGLKEFFAERHLELAYTSAFRDYETKRKLNAIKSEAVRDRSK